jgi:hypothetical protein
MWLEPRGGASWKAIVGVAGLPSEVHSSDDGLTWSAPSVVPLPTIPANGIFTTIAGDGHGHWLATWDEWTTYTYLDLSCGLCLFPRQCAQVVGAIAPDDNFNWGAAMPVSSASSTGYSFESSTLRPTANSRWVAACERISYSSDPITHVPISYWDYFTTPVLMANQPAPVLLGADAALNSQVDVQPSLPFTCSTSAARYSTAANTIGNHISTAIDYHYCVGGPICTLAWSYFESGTWRDSSNLTVPTLQGCTPAVALGDQNLAVVAYRTSEADHRVMFHTTQFATARVDNWKQYF